MARDFSTIEQKVTGVVLEKMKLYAFKALSKYPMMQQSADIFIWEQARVVDELVYIMTAEVMRSPRKQMGFANYDVPATWWDAFKLEKFPKWLLNKFPPNYKVKHVNFEQNFYICPHADVPWPDQKHLLFMYQEDDIKKVAK